MPKGQGEHDQFKLDGVHQGVQTPWKPSAHAPWRETLLTMEPDLSTQVSYTETDVKTLCPW